MNLLRVRNLRTEFSTEQGLVRAVQGISFDLDEGEILGVVGESGSGKSVAALSIMRMIPEPPGRVTADELVFERSDLLALDPVAVRDIRGAGIAMVFQDPMRSLNPVLTVGRQLTEMLRRHLRLDHRAATRRAVELLDRVGIPMAEKRLAAYPHQLSGGMRQRVMIAIALSCKPRLLIADEATTALDVTIQAQILDLVKELQRELGTAVIWISHDLGIVAGLCDRVQVMYAGRIVETGPVDDVFERPSHGYTLGLMASTPAIDQSTEGGRLTPIDGSPPNLAEITTLCPFLPRCRFHVPVCSDISPPSREIGLRHAAACLADLRMHWRLRQP